MEYALTGAHFPADRAHAWGLVNRLTAPGEALAGAVELARAILANGPLGVRTSKRLILESASWEMRGPMKMWSLCAP